MLEASFKYPAGLPFPMPKTILVVEDEENIAKGHKILFRDYNVLIASTGEQALTLAKQHRPDVIILDLMLPERNGYDVCFHLRQDTQFKETKIIMLTAKNLDMDKKKGVFVGADIYMTKPFDPSALKETVQRLLTHV